MAPFIVEPGSSSAFVTAPDGLFMSPALINHVETFDPNGSGENFNPQVTTGVAPCAFLDKMLEELFESFTFSAPTAAVYQLGQFRTAAKKLNEWTSTP